MKQRLVYCEGQDDVKALRGIIRRKTGLPFHRDEDFPRARQSARFELSPETYLSIVAQPRNPEQGGGTLNRDAAIWYATTEISEPRSPDRSMIGLCIDLDGDSLDSLRRIIHRSLPASALDTDIGWSLDGRELALLPWHIETPLFDRLPDVHNLERVAIHALCQSRADCKGLVEGLLDQLANHRGDKHRIWKAAKLLFHAATFPKTTEESFFDEVFCNNDDIIDAAITALAPQPFWKSLESLCTP